MRGKKEIIKLDAIIVNVIKESIFVVELANGHRMVAVVGGRSGSGVSRGAELRAGDRVSVAVCPGDMVSGHIVNG